MGGLSIARAARLVGFGEPLRVEDVELPPPAEGEVTVQLAFGGVNPVDAYAAGGTVASDGPLPRTLGGEASGTLDGKPVLVSGAGLGSRRDGVWASAAVVPRNVLVALPEGLDLRVAAAAGVAGLTAWNVVKLGSVTSADRVVVLGASGGVGLPIVSLVSSLGAMVWGQTRSIEKEQAVRALGAADVVVGDSAGLREALSGFEPTIVFDPLGSPFTQEALASLVPGGRLVLFGASAGASGELQLRDLYRNNLRVLGYGGLMLSDAERVKDLPDALEAIADGRMRIPIGRTLELDQANVALDLLREGALTGKIVLELS
jgi:NADPH:quinone reductase